MDDEKQTKMEQPLRYFLIKLLPWWISFSFHHLYVWIDPYDQALGCYYADKLVRFPITTIVVLDSSHSFLATTYGVCMYVS